MSLSQTLSRITSSMQCLNRVSQSGVIAVSSVTPCRKNTRIGPSCQKHKRVEDYFNWQLKTAKNYSTLKLLKPFS